MIKIIIIILFGFLLAQDSTSVEDRLNEVAKLRIENQMQELANLRLEVQAQILSSTEQIEISKEDLGRIDFAGMTLNKLLDPEIMPATVGNYVKDQAEPPEDDTVNKTKKEKASDETDE